MSNKEIKFRSDKLDSFGILTDLHYPGTCNYFGNFQRKDFLKLIIELQHNQWNNLEIYHDIDNSYMYYLYSYMRGVEKWYNNSIFTFYTTITGNSDKSDQLIFVKNNKNNWLDNVIYKKCLDDIQSRILLKSKAYVAANHAVERAPTRVPEIAECESKFKIAKWLLNQVNNCSRSAHIKCEYFAFSLLRHHFQKADYYMDHHRNVYVVVNHVIMTIHCNESERWELN